MGVLVVLDQKCQYYSEQFSPEKQAYEIIKRAFPVPNDRKKEKCNREAPWKQDGSRCPVIDYGEKFKVKPDQALLSVPEQIAALTSSQKKEYATPEGIVELNKKGISLAVDRRVALFFQQAILCYKMSAFTFSVGGADGQIGSASELAFGEQLVHKREAAHSSTIPSLIAHAKDGSTPNGFIYLKGGSSYNQHQGTIGMHVLVNGADELIDGKGSEEKLRAATVKILNLVANGLDPVKATKQFIKAFREQLRISCRELKAKEKEKNEIDGRRLVLEKYADKLKKVVLASKQKQFYDQMVGVIIDTNDPNATILRKEIYQKRYDVIRMEEVIENRIGKRIADAKKQMKVGEKTFLEYILLNDFAETKERVILEKLFCKTAAIFEANYEKKMELNRKQERTIKSFRTRVSNIKKDHAILIASLGRKLRKDFWELDSIEFTYRSGVFKTLRWDVHKWYGREFCEEYFKTTGQKVSTTWVSRMEELARLPTKSKDEYKSSLSHRRRYVSLQDAFNCAQTFKVDPGIFLPSLFTSA